MRPDVSLQQPRTREGLLADVTLVGQRVRAQMHFHGARRFVEFAARRAAVALLGLVTLGGLTVELDVLGEARVRRVGLVARLTLVSWCWVSGRRRGRCGRGNRCCWHFGKVFAGRVGGGTMAGCVLADGGGLGGLLMMMHVRMRMVVMVQIFGQGIGGRRRD